MTTTPSTTRIRSDNQARVGKASRFAALVFLVTFAAGVVYLYLAARMGAWQLVALAGGVAVTLIATGAGLMWMRRGRVDLGVKLMIGATLATILLSSILIADLGLAMGAIAVMLTSAVAALTLPQKSASRAIIASIVVGATALLLDLPGLLTYRLNVPELQAVAPAIAGALAVVYGIFIARQFKNYSLRTKLILAFLVVSFIPLGVSAFFNYRAIQEALIIAANQALSAAAGQTAADIDDFISAGLEAIGMNAQTSGLAAYLSVPADRRPNTSLRTEVLAALRAFRQKEFVNISSYVLLDVLGQDVADTYTVDIGLDKSDRDYFQVPLKTGLPYVSPVELSPTGEASIYFSSAVRSSLQEIIGVLVARYDASVLQDVLDQTTGLAGSESFAVLFDENHLHLAHGTAPETIFKSVVPLDPERAAQLKEAGRLPNWPDEQLFLNLPDLEHNLHNAATQPFFAATDVATGNRVNQVAVTPLKTQPWLIAFFQPQDVFLAPARAQTQALVLLGVVIAGLVALAAVGMSNLLAGPIARLTRVAEQIAFGDLSAQAPVESFDEIGALAITFNTMTTQVRSAIGALEQNVAARTAQLQASAEVGRAAASILDPDHLLREVVNLITDRFGFYYAAVFTLDAEGQFAVLREATGEAGRILKARGHKLEVGGLSMVGYATGQCQPRIALDVGEEAVRFANPLLPDTHSEIALPLVVGERVLGALDVQSTQASAFDEARAAALQAMADQIAIALNNATSYAEAQAAAQRARVLYATSQQAGRLEADLSVVVDEMMRGMGDTLGYSYWSVITLNDSREWYTSLASTTEDADAGQQLRTADQPDDPAVGSAVHGETHLINDPERDPRLGDLPADWRARLRLLSVPILSRDAPIGALTLGRPLDAPPLTEVDLEVGRSLAGLVAIAIQNRRLFEQTRQALDEVDAVNRRLTGEAWTRFAQRATGQRPSGGLWVSSSGAPEQAEEAPEVAESLASGHIIARPGVTPHTLDVAVPVLLRGMAIGALRLSLPEHAWTDELAGMLETLAGHIAQAAENARLVEQAEERAWRERTLSASTDKIRSQTDMEHILQAAAEELARHLKAARVAVRLNPALQSPRPTGEGSAVEGPAPSIANGSAGNGQAE